MNAPCPGVAAWRPDGAALTPPLVGRFGPEVADDRGAAFHHCDGEGGGGVGADAARAATREYMRCQDEDDGRQRRDSPARPRSSNSIWGRF